MSITLKACRVTILVKAFPQYSTKYEETVCCAGITEHGEFKRLYPIRYRNLAKDAAFNRWDWVNFKYETPLRDRRKESCHVMEDKIKIVGKMPKKDRSIFLNRYVSESVRSASDKGMSLALIRPKNPKFIIKKRKSSELEEEKEKYERAVKQKSLLDKDLEAIVPVRYKFMFKFEDEAEQHTYTAGDWETSAMFNREEKRKGADKAIEWMKRVFDEEYPQKGMLFCVGNVARRPHTWTLLGVIRADHPNQGTLF